MLVGNIEYHENNISYNYKFKGIDNSSMLSGVLETNYYNAMQFLGGNDDSLNAMATRRFEVKLTNVKVEQPITVDSNTGKKVKHGFNIDFFCKLGALIRYCKYQCKPEHEKGYVGFCMTEYIPEKTKSYYIKDAYNNDIGEITLEYGEIKALAVQTDKFSIDIEDDQSVQERLFSIKDSTAKGFSFGIEFLGFQAKWGTANNNADANYTGGGLYSSLEEVQNAHPDKEFSYLLDKKYIIVDDSMLDELKDYFLNWEGKIYFDTETTGLKINFKSRIGQADQCVGLILSVVAGESYYFPMQMNYIPNLCNGDHFYFMEHYMREILESKPIVVHNAAFDWRVAYIYDINTNIVDDTMALYAITLGVSRKAFPTGLKSITKLLFGWDALELSDLVVADKWGESEITFADLPPELVKLYACADTDNTRAIMQYAETHDLLHQYNAERIYRIEVLFSLAVGYQTFYGHRVDVSDMEKLITDVEADKQYNVDKMIELTGHPFNPNSPAQLANIMYKELNIPLQTDRAKGTPSTNKETLKYLMSITDGENKPQYPFAKYLYDYRIAEGVNKIVGKFDELATEDGFLFSDVYQYGTTTGRVSIHQPNYQSYNDAVKKYIRPREGFYMADTDYSSVEYRVIGNMSGNKMIKDGFYDPDFDYHTYQAARMYNIPYSAVTSSMRKQAKGFNFGIPYGMGDESLGLRIFGSVSPENTMKAAKLHRKYFEGGQEDVEYFLESNRDKALNLGYSETYFGRRRYYFKDEFSTTKIRSQAGNAIIQGCLGGDTKIQTRDFGIVPISVVVDYRLDVWDGEEWTQGDICYSGKKQKCIVKFSCGLTMICSPIHKFQVVSHEGDKSFVECQNLKTMENSADPSRVVVNPEYCPSEHIYDSTFAKQYAINTNNTRNLFLEDIENSYDIGVFLGRLVSDGSYTSSKDANGVYIEHFISEPENSITKKLKSIMKNYEYIEKEFDSVTSNEKPTAQLSVYSTSLVKEVETLDIKHQIHENIFMDTEVLRGFLSGIFNSSRGIFNKVIKLVFDTQYDFEPMCLDIQKALLFLGIRSHYHKFADSYTIDIETQDNQRFIKFVGLLNEEQANANIIELSHSTDKSISSGVLVVESVEITDEYIDMYDVCNTERGYYVADGVVTHNTAADIYKLAVGRVFSRICKEGLLGKILIPGFIHDELLLEIHNSIDPMRFLKMLREEFEVKIEGWCPLYMGFGFGMSWYEAKKTELPIQLQWQLVESYGDSGYPSWDGDGYKLCAEVPNILRRYEIEHIKEYILSPDNQNKEIKPAINTQLLGVLENDQKIYTSVLKSAMKDYEISNIEVDIKAYLKENAVGVYKKAVGAIVKRYADNYAEDTAAETIISDYSVELTLELWDKGFGDLCAVLDKSNSAVSYLNAHKQEVITELAKNGIDNAVYSPDADTVLCFDYKQGNNIKTLNNLDTQIALDIYCRMHNVDRSQVNILNIDTNVSTEQSTSSDVSANDDMSIDNLGIFDDSMSEEDKQRAIDYRVDTLGMYLDTETNTVTLKLLPVEYLNYIQTKVNRTGLGYRIRFKDAENKRMLLTECYLPSEEIQSIQNLYILYYSRCRS